MDCLCCAGGGKGPTSDTEFLGSICNLKKTSDGTPVIFPVEPNRYTLYLIAGCPFAARPWTVSSFYGLSGKANSVIKVCKCFPAAHDDGWFLTPVSDGEKELVDAFPIAQVDVDPNGYDISHVRQLYEKAKPGFKGAISVPLLWDSKQDTAVSNSSLGLSEMIATQMRCRATRNADRVLFPCRETRPLEYQQHSDLVKKIHAQVTTPVYRINATTNGGEHDKLVDEYYSVLDEFERRLGGETPSSHFLMGDEVRFADFVLFISLVRLDLAYQWRFGLGKKSIRENYPNLWKFQRRILQIPGIAETVLPRDIMALYFLTPKWVKACAGRMSLPQVPESWETGCTGEGCMF